MNFVKRAYFIFFLLAAALMVGCGPSVTVENRTTIAVRVVITSPNGSEVVSPSPGESSTAEVSEGAYRATVIPDAEWIEYAKLVRKDLNEQLANSDKLTGPQLLDLVRRLKEIAARMDQFTQTAGQGASCGGAVTQDSSNVVAISIGANGKLVASCK